MFVASTENKYNHQKKPKRSCLWAYLWISAILACSQPKISKLSQISGFLISEVDLSKLKTINILLYRGGISWAGMSFMY